jgi:hypothetical protein
VIFEIFLANFLEFRTREVRRVYQPVEKVGIGLVVTTLRAPESPKYGVFGAESGAKAGTEVVFQHAVIFHALQ